MNHKDLCATRAVIEAEMKYHEAAFRDKVVYCNCDHPEKSQFVAYFRENFDRLGLRGLLCSFYSERDFVYKIALWRDPQGGGQMDPVKIFWHGSGRFWTNESVDTLRQADIVVTMPPMDKTRELIEQCLEFKKQFLVLGPRSTDVINGIVPMMRAGQLRYGVSIHSTDREFETETGERVRVAGVRWFTNLETAGYPKLLILSAKYAGHESKYPKFDFREVMDVINVRRVLDIPADYMDVMAVPVTFLDAYTPEQFDIVNLRKTETGVKAFSWQEEWDIDTAMYMAMQSYPGRGRPVDISWPRVAPGLPEGMLRGYVDGKNVGRRIMIRRKQ